MRTFYYSQTKETCSHRRNNRGKKYHPQLLKEYDIETAKDIQDAFRDLFDGTIKKMMEVEMNDHLGYVKSECSNSDDYHNGYKRRQINIRYDSMEIEVPQN